jgi:hypothetical protein
MTLLTAPLSSGQVCISCCLCTTSAGCCGFLSMLSFSPLTCRSPCFSYLVGLWRHGCSRNTCTSDGMAKLQALAEVAYTRVSVDL